MAADLVLGVDCSTTASKVIAWDRDGKEVAVGRDSLTEIREQPEYSEQDAHEWWTATVGCIKDVLGQIDTDRVAGICITHQRESFAPVDADGTPTYNAILWDDARAQPQLDELGEKFGHDALLQRTGRGPSLTQSFPKLLWLVENHPDTAKDAVKFVDTAGYIIQRLTGSYTTSLASADSFGIVDMGKDEWATDLIEGIGLRAEQFCDTVPPGTEIGKVTADAASATGLPEGIPVIAGVGDGQSACLGAGVTSLDRAYLNLGTAVTGGPVSPEYVANTSCRTLYAGAPGTFVLESVLRGGMATVTWFMKEFNDDSDFDQLEAAAKAVGPGADGLVLVPYWNNVMNPYWDGTASGMVVGWHWGHDRAHLFRAIMEGLAFEFRLAMNGIEEATGTRIEEYVILGGGSNSTLWCQIMADVLGARVVRSHTVEATCLGSGILGAYGVGWYSSVEEAADAMTDTTDAFEPDADVSAYYEKLYTEVYTPLFPAVQGQLHALTELRAEGRALRS